MPLDDQDAYELLRRRLEDDVKQKVESDLFRYYRNLGSIIIAVLGAVGISIGWPALLARIDTQIAIKVKEPVAAATKTANDANEIANGILARLEDKQENLNQSIGRLGGKFDEMHVRYGQASSQIETVEEHVGEMRQLTEFFKSRVQSNPVSREEIRQLEARLAEVIAQTGVLADAINALGADAPGPEQPVSKAQRKLKEIYAEQAIAVEIAQATDANPRMHATVYVQFAGGRREDIQLISKYLLDAGWTVPGEERLGAAAGKREVRYFHDSDAATADLLAEDVNKAVTAVGFKRLGVKGRQVAVKHKPAAGILELWVEIPLR